MPAPLSIDVVCRRARYQIFASAGSGGPGPVDSASSLRVEYLPPYAPPYKVVFECLCSDEGRATPVSPDTVQSLLVSCVCVCVEGGREDTLSVGGAQRVKVVSQRLCLCLRYRRLLVCCRPTRPGSAVGKRDEGVVSVLRRRRRLIALFVLRADNGDVLVAAGWPTRHRLCRRAR
uniref:Uncharacterized protein n=1 Tax=Plectus sambesii TaxID=2011161 RepID=A0A914WMG2_9BILA